VLAANPRSVEEFKAGKEKAFNALVGQAMKATKGKANPQQVNEVLRRRLTTGLKRAPNYLIFSSAVRCTGVAPVPAAP